MFRKQSGQVLPLGLALVVLGLLGAFMLFNTGQLASEKMRLANAADAAAYSGALWQARALNYQAYANRAMVANQVAVAQAVSLQSWFTYAAVASQSVATITALIPIVNVGTSATERAMAAAGPVVATATNAMITVSNAAITALSLSQTAIHLAAMFNTEEVIATVARETDSRFHTHSLYGLGATARHVSQWANFSNSKTKRDISAVKERQDLIMASRDKFTRDRDWTLFENWFPASLVLLLKVTREGDTRLVANETAEGVEWEWVAKDNLSLQMRVPFSGFLDRFTTTEWEVPIAWSSAYANSNSNRQRIVPCRSGRGDVCSQFTDDNRLAERFADRNTLGPRGGQSLTPKYGYSGVRKFWVLSDSAREEDDARLMVRVEVSLPAETLREADDLTSGDQLASPIIVAGNTLSSISAAEVLYKRPQHHFLPSSEREKANSYNPYWQVQLAPVSVLERIGAVATRSGGVTARNKRGEVL